MKNYFITTFFCTFFCTINSMDSAGFELFNPYSWFSRTNQNLWLKTSDNQYIECDQMIINQSAILTLLKKIGSGSCKNKAAPLGLSAEEINMFIRACTNTLMQLTYAHNANKSYDLLAIADTLKSPKLYAVLIGMLLPPDVDKKIAEDIFSLKKITKIAIQRTPLYNSHRSLCISHTFYLDSMPDIKIEYNHTGDYYITSFTTEDMLTKCYLWDAHNDKTIAAFDYDTAQFSPTRKQLLLARTLPNNLKQKDPALLYDIATGTNTLLSNAHNISSIVFSPDGNTIAATFYDHTQHHIIRLWDISDCNNIHTADLIGHNEKVNAIAFSPNSKQLVSGSTEITNPVILWDISNPYSIQRKTIIPQQPCYFTNFIFSTSGSFILGKTQNDNPLLITLKKDNFYNALYNKTFRYATANIQFIPTKDLLLHGLKNGSLEIYNPSTNKYAYCIQSEVNTLNAFTASKDGRYIAASHENNALFVWELNKENIVSKKTVITNNFPIQSLQFNNDGFLLGYSHDHRRLWDTDGSTMISIQPHYGSAFHSALYSPDGNKILSVAIEQFQKNVLMQNHSATITHSMLITPKTKNTLTQMKNSITTAQATLLNSIDYKPMRLKNPPLFKKHSLDDHIFESFDPKCQQLLRETLFITFKG